MARNCRATAKSTGKRCKAQAINGAGLCRLHGVNKATRKKAAAAVAREEILRYAAEKAQEGDALEEPDPQQVLERLMNEERRVLGFWGIVVEEKITQGDSLVRTNKHGEPVIAPEVTQRNDSSVRLARFAKYGLDADISERRLQIEEGKARLFLEAVQAGIAETEHHLPVEVQQAITRSIGRHLRLLGPGEAPSA